MVGHKSICFTITSWQDCKPSVLVALPTPSNKSEQLLFLSRFTDEEVDEMYREAPIKGGMFDYIEFTRILKHGAKDKDEA